MFLREFVLIFYAHDKCGYSAKAVTPLQVHAPLLVRRCVYFQKMIINGAFCLGEESRSYRLLRQQTNQEREQFFFLNRSSGEGRFPGVALAAAEEPPSAAESSLVLGCLYGSSPLYEIWSPPFSCKNSVLERLERLERLNVPKANI